MSRLWLSWFLSVLIFADVYDLWCREPWPDGLPTSSVPKGLVWYDCLATILIAGRLLARDLRANFREVNGACLCLIFTSHVPLISANTCVNVLVGSLLLCRLLVCAPSSRISFLYLPWEAIIHKNVTFEAQFCGTLVGCSFCLSHCCEPLTLSGRSVGYSGRLSSTKHGRRPKHQTPWKF